MIVEGGGLFPCLLWSQGNLTLQPLSTAVSEGLEWLSGDSAMQVRRAWMGSIQGMMVHADGRAEIGHHRVVQDSTQALALVHAGPRMRCRQLGLSPFLVPKHPQSVIIGPPPLTLLSPALALQKRNKGVGIQSWCWGLQGLGICANMQCCQLE